MQLGIIGLGRMGGNIARRLKKHGHEMIVFDLDQKTVGKLAGEGMTGASSLHDMITKMEAPRSIWVMLPSGKITEDTIADLAEHLEPGDTVIDGGNSFYKDDIRRAKVLEQKKLHYIDVGTSGGVWGLERGYCMMIGGDDEAVGRIDPILKALAPGVGEIEKTPGRGGHNPTAELGYLHCGPAGAGHFVKMIHNGIEYGMMQAYAEGFDIMRTKNSPLLAEDQRFDLKLADIAEVWRRGSVVSSWLLDLTAIALAENETLDKYSGNVSDSGEGRWTVEAAIEEAVPAEVLSAALYARFRSRQSHTYGEKLLSAMRFQFGGHLELNNNVTEKS